MAAAPAEAPAAPEAAAAAPAEAAEATEADGAAGIEDTPALDSLDLEQDAEIEAAAEAADGPGCPICRFIEAGPCGDQHKVWAACRQEAKEQDVDFVKQCADTFRSFFGCMLSHQDYYQPFLEAFEVDVPRSQQALDIAKHEQQQQQQQEVLGGEQQSQRQQQQDQQQEVVGGEQQSQRQQQQQQTQHPPEADDNSSPDSSSN